MRASPFVLVAFLAACSTSPTAPTAPDFAAGGNSQRFPFTATLGIGCGAGEFVAISGTLHVVVADQGAAVHVTVNPQDATGVGLTTGTVYRVTGIGYEFTTAAGRTETAVTVFRIIGPGLAANVSVHEVSHITINANGVATVAFDKATEECKQG